MAHASTSGLLEMATRNLKGVDSGEPNLLNGIEKHDKKTQNGYKNGYKNGYNTQHTNGHLPKTQITKYGHGKDSFEPPTFISSCLTYFGFYILVLLGFVNELIGKVHVPQEQNRKGYPLLYDKFEQFYMSYVFRRVRDCWTKPISSVPGAVVMVKNRVARDFGYNFDVADTEKECINLASYNYLGFAENVGECADLAIQAVKDYGLAFCSARSDLGTCDLHLELETLTARFLGMEDATTCGMGFATNALNIPTLLSEGCIVLSDEKNHNSLILGLRISKAIIRVFKHNDMAHLERLLIEAHREGQPNCKKYTPWKKIFIFVEGIYSMEGTIVPLPKVIELKKKYKAYLYLDEAHSIGALGKHGRGVLDYHNCDPKDVDILMGTFTKSFGSAGGYIAGSKELIEHIRKHSNAEKTGTAMSPPVAAQIIAVMKILMGLDGTDKGRKRIEQLARNTRYFRRRLAQMGFITYGNEDSPVIPILVYLYSKIGYVTRTLEARNVAIVGVAYPATPLMQGRLRICLSAAHTKEQLDYVLNCLNEIADEAGLKYSRLPRDPNPIEYEDIVIQ